MICKKTLTALILLITLQTQAQKGFSLATDLSVLYNLTPNASFSSVGQTVRSQVHFTNTETAYAWLNYYSEGRYKNNLVAAPFDPVNDQPVNFISSSKVKYHHISLGWQHFIKGNFDNDDWSLYSLAGFGLLKLNVNNSYNKAIDTSRYIIPQKAIAGSSKFHRLTLDIGLGGETKLGTGIFLYGEVRKWIKASGYENPYLYNNNLPNSVSANVGLRVLFDY